jgi:hypothetical protein
MQALGSEMSYYEQLSGRKSVFNLEVCMSLIIILLYLWYRFIYNIFILTYFLQEDGINCSIASKFTDINSSGKKVLNQKKMMRHLVSLVNILYFEDFLYSSKYYYACNRFVNH